MDKGSLYEERHGWERPSYFVTNEEDINLKPYDYYGKYEEPMKHPVYPYWDELRKEYTFETPASVYNIVSSIYDINTQ